MKPLVVIEEEEGPFERPWACVNHLFPFHLGRRPLRRPPLAGAGWSFTPVEEALFELVSALATAGAHRGLGEVATTLGAFRERCAESGGLPWGTGWWLGAAPFVAARLSTIGRLDAFEEGPRRELLLTWMRGRDRSAHVEMRLAELLDLLDGQGVRGLVLKGLAHAHAWYPEPGSRPAGDIDLLVRPEDLERTFALLTARGWRPTGTERSDGWRGHHHARPLVSATDGEPVLLELHTRLAAELVDTPRASFATWHDLLWERAGEIEGRFRPLPAPCAVDRLAHAIAHHTVELSFKGLLDLGLAAHAESGATWAAAHERLPRELAWRATLAAGLARDLFGAAGPLAALPERDTEPVERAATPRWGAAHAAWMCRAGGRERPRHWLEGFAPRVDELCRAPRLHGRPGSVAMASARYAGRQARLVGRVVTDLHGFLLPPRGEVSGGYASNVAMASKSALSRLLRGLLGPHRGSTERSHDRDGV